MSAMSNGCRGPMLAFLGALWAAMTLSPRLGTAQFVERGELSSGDEVRDGGQFSDPFELEALPNQRAAIILLSDEFDTYLQVITPNGRFLENDDSGSTRVSMIRLSTGEGGIFQISATSLLSDEVGSYQLAVVLEDSDPTVIDARLEGRPRQFPIMGDAGQRICVTLTSDAFDTVLRLNGQGEMIAENDDSTDGTNSYIEAVLPYDGNYTVDVDSYGAADGAFKLIVDVLPPAELSELGELATGDETLQSGEFADRHTIDGQTGQILEVHATSAEFNTYIIVKSPSGVQFENDDADGTNAALFHVLEEAGVYEVIVTSYAVGELGSYSLTADLIGSGGAPNRPPKP